VKRKQSEQEACKSNYFYFDVADPSHQRLQEKEFAKTVDKPLERIQEATEVDY
jgi:hypothetical protein